MSESPRDVVRRWTNDDVVTAFDHLVDRWEESQSARYALENYERSEEKPQPPESPIESVGELINFNRQRWLYEQALEELHEQYEEKARTFNETAQKIKELLPENYVVYHTYGGGNSELQERNYTVGHLPPERGSASGKVIVKQGRDPKPL
jgi:hypothetical protein